MEAQIQSTVWSLIIGAGLLLGAIQETRQTNPKGCALMVAAIIGTVLLAYAVASMLFGISDMWQRVLAS